MVYIDDSFKGNHAMYVIVVLDQSEIKAIIEKLNPVNDALLIRKLEGKLIDNAIPKMRNAEYRIENGVTIE